MKYFAIAIVLLSLAAFALPQPVGYVNDFGNILVNGTALEQELRNYESATTIEIAVVTLDGLPEDQTLFTYGVELFDQWNIGKSDDNGILILLTKNGTTGNRLRIELGYGIQGYITGAEAGRVLDKAVPYYEQSDYDSAVRIILDGLYEQLTSYKSGISPRSSGFDLLFNIILPNIVPFIFLAVVIISAVMANRCPYCIRGKLIKKNDHYVCKRCGRKVTRRRRYAPLIVGGGRHGGMGGGFGGFGGGGSGGGGAGR